MSSEIFQLLVPPLIPILAKGFADPESGFNYDIRNTRRFGLKSILFPMTFNSVLGFVISYGIDIFNSTASPEGFTPDHLISIGATLLTATSTILVGKFSSRNKS